VGGSERDHERRQQGRSEEDRDYRSSRDQDRRRRRSSRSRSPPPAPSRDSRERSSRYKEERRPKLGGDGGYRSRESGRPLPPPPDFERDRRRERAAYDASSGARSGETAQANEPGGAEPAAANHAPDFSNSGLLAAASNNVEGIALKYHEPPEARKPKQGKGWRLYVFKNGKDADLIHLTRQSCYILGRERRVVDIPLEHVSASKQHAVIQFRQVTERNEFGDEKRSILPFLIDLESANGTFLNGTEVPTSRYVGLKSGDTLTFGADSKTEWVLLPEDAA